MHRHPYHHPRSLNIGGSKSTTIIVLSVAGFVGVVIVTMFLFRMIRILFRLDQYHPAPLPPIQPLAHHREQQLAQFIDRDRSASPSRPATWYDAGLEAPPIFASSSGSRSDISLLHRKASSVSEISPYASPGRSEKSEPMEEFSALSGSPAVDFPGQTGADGLEIPSLPSTPHSRASSASGYVPAARPRPRTVSQNQRLRSRPVSMSSVLSTSRSSRTIRGPPHSPHNHVQIVLPMPLAPSLHGSNPSTRRHTFIDEFTADRSPSRLSVVDQWAQIPVRSHSAERRSLNIGDSHTSTALSATRIASHPRNIPSPSANAPPHLPPPPVPRIPSVYNVPPASIEIIVQDTQVDKEPEPIERGRTHATSSPPISLRSHSQADTIDEP
jgi:hypothetical protein